MLSVDPKSRSIALAEATTPPAATSGVSGEAPPPTTGEVTPTPTTAGEEAVVDARERGALTDVRRAPPKIEVVASCRQLVEVCRARRALRKL